MPSPLPPEFEAKFYYVDPVVVRSTLHNNRAVLIQPETLYRRAVFEFPDNAGMSGDYARVRDEGVRITMSIKRHARNGEGMQANGERCLQINSFDDGCALLLDLGMRQKAYQETKRETWTLDGVEICIDTWPGLRPYVEIEAPNEALVLATAKLLTLDRLRSTPGGVDVLYCEEYGVTPERVNRQTPLITFDHPPEWTVQQA